MVQAVSVEYGKYVLKAGKVGAVFLARAFLRPPTNRKGHLAEEKGETVDAALTALKARLAREAKAARDGRRICDENKVHVPSVAEFRMALQSLSFGDKERAMLVAHALRGPAGLTTVKIGLAGDYAEVGSTNLQYARVARKFADLLDIGPIPPVGGYGRNVPEVGAGNAVTSAIAQAGAPEAGAFVWVMHHELREALALEGWLDHQHGKA